MAAPIAACVTIGASASAAVAPQTPAVLGAGQYAVAGSLVSPRAQAASARRRRKSSNCTNTHKQSRKRSANCKAASHRVTVRAPHAKRPRPASTKVAAPAVEGAPTAAGIIAKVLATPCQNTQLIPEPGNLALVRAAVLCLINTERAQNGREPLIPDARLEQAAEGHGKEMLSLDYFDHVAPSGLTPVQRIRTTGYIPGSEVGYVIGENLAWGTLTLATPQAIVNAWIASPEHLANILEGKYRDTGIDVEPEVPQALAEGVAGALYTQEFGVIVR
jgi:uncharacterized protein YkwD